MAKSKSSSGGSGKPLKVELGPQSDAAMREVARAARALADLFKNQRAGGGIPGALPGPVPGFGQPSPFDQIYALQYHQALIQGQSPGPGATSPRTPTAFRQAQTTLSERAGILANLGFGGTASTMTRIGGVASGLEGLGFTRAGAFLSRAALPLAGLSTVAGGTKAFAASYHDELLTADQATRAFIKNADPFGIGAAGIDYYDTLSGRKRSLQRTEEQGRILDVRNEGMIEAQRMKLQIGLQQSSAQNRASVLGSASPVLMPNIDRTTAAGERQFRLEQRLLPIREKMARAERESSIAAKDIETAEKRRYDLGVRAVDLELKRTELAREIKKTEQGSLNLSGAATGLIVGGAVGGAVGLFSGGGDETRRLELLKEQSRNQRAIEANEQDRIQAEENMRRARENAARANADKIRGQAEMDRARGEYKESQAESAAGSAARLALLGPAGRARAKFAFDLLQKHPELATQSPELAGQALQFAPEDARKLLEKQGEKLDEYRHGQKVAPGAFPLKPGETIAGARKEATELQNKAAEGDLKAEQQEAVGVAAALDGHFERILQMFLKALDMREKRIMNELLQGRSHQ